MPDNGTSISVANAVLFAQTASRQFFSPSYFIFILKWIAPYYKLSMGDSSFVFVLLRYREYHE
ncbi:MAG TPA: hypothetical protein VI037_03410, partial [Nitrososphaera sp.]